MSRIRALSILLAALLALTLIAPAAAQEPTTITLMRFFGECSDEFAGITDLEQAYGECGIIQVLINKWNAENPDLQVETVVADWPATVQLNAALAAGAPPDIVVLHNERIASYVARGLLTPLGDAFAAAGIDMSDFIPAAQERVTMNGQIFGLPWDIPSPGLWQLNMDVWAQAGLVDDAGAPVLPTSEEEFLAAAQKVKDATGLPFVDLQTDGHNGTTWPWISFIYQQGGSIIDADGNPNVNTPEALRALTFLKSWIDLGYTTPKLDYSAAEQNFLNGRNASWFTGTWVVDFYVKQVEDPETPLKNYRVAPYPQLYEKRASFASGHNWVVPLGVNADPARLEPIMRVMKFLYDNEFAWAKTGHIAVRQSILDSPEYQAMPHRNEYAEVADITFTYPNASWILAFESITNEEIQAVYIGDKTPEQALADMQARLEDFAAFAQ